MGNGNQVIVITGATSGIGRATALKFASNGDSVVLASRSEDNLTEVAVKCEALGGRALKVRTDVSNEEDIERLAKEAVTAFGKIDVWINNAAVIVFGPFLDIPPEDFRRVIEVNLFGYVYGARAALRQFMEQGYGNLINVSSVAGVVGQPFAVPYSASKFANRGLGISLDQEFKDEKNIHISTLILSTIDTPIYSQGANYTGKKIAPPVAVTPAYKVADAIFRLSKHPRARTFIGKSTAAMRIGRFLFPTIFDKIAYWKTIIQQFEDEPVGRTAGNLYEPRPEAERVEGGWLERKQKQKTAPLIIGAAALLIGLGLLLKKVNA